MGLRRAVAGTAGRGHRFLSLLRPALSLSPCSVCRRRRDRGFFGTWTPGVMPQTKGLDGSLGLVVHGLCEALPGHLPLNVFLELSVSKIRVNPEPVSANPSPTRIRRARSP